MAGIPTSCSTALRACIFRAATSVSAAQGAAGGACTAAVRVVARRHAVTASDKAMGNVAKAMLLFVALYPLVTAALWIAGGLLFHIRDEREGGATATAAAAGDPRCRVIRDDVNRGKAHQLNGGFHETASDVVVVTDADTHMHPQAIKLRG